MNYPPNGPLIIAFYLPQFHPIPENDKWWGKGFTEWTNVGKAKALFKGHYQPRVPADLGYYDLRMPHIREEQAEMAKHSGIFGFCYWHYWFGNGQRLLEKPFNDVLYSGKPSFPFCLGWANESWKSKIWNGTESYKSKVLIEQKYPGKQDNEMHFYSLLDAFKDKRYIRVKDRPLFLIYKPEDFPGMKDFITEWNSLAKNNGISQGFHFVAHTSSFNSYYSLINLGFNSITVNPISRLIHYLDLKKSRITKYSEKLEKYIFGYRKFIKVEYKNARKHFINKYEDSIANVIPTIIPNWDHSPRSGRHGLILVNSDPKYFAKNIRDAIQCIKDKNDGEKIIFLKSWNEWGEGNYMEPDIKYKHGYLDVLRRTISI